MGPLSLATDDQGHTFILSLPSLESAAPVPFTTNIPTRTEDSSREVPPSSSMDYTYINKNSGIDYSQRTVASSADSQEVPPTTQELEVIEEEDSRILSPSVLEDLRQKYNDSRSSFEESWVGQLIDHAFAMSEKLAVVEERSAEKAQNHATKLSQVASAQEKLKHERWEVEIELLRRQATALSRILIEERGNKATGKIESERENVVLQENRKLKADIRFQARELKNQEEHHLKLNSQFSELRSRLLNASPLIATDTVIRYPTRTSFEGSKATSSSLPRSKPKRKLTMGDAEAEHLLLAGKRLSHVRRINRIPLSAAILEQAHEIVHREQFPEQAFDAEQEMEDSRYYMDVDGNDTSTMKEHGHPYPRHHSYPTSRYDSSAGTLSALQVLADQATAVEGAPEGSQHIEDLLKMLENESENEPSKNDRARYLKWSVQEDEILLKAVIQHGQRWDDVASCVPTRTYHQCRQRFLRGLRSGDAIPKSLAHLKARVKQSVKEYEQFKRNKGKNAGLLRGEGS